MGDSGTFVAPEHLFKNQRVAALKGRNMWLFQRWGPRGGSNGTFSLSREEALRLARFIIEQEEDDDGRNDSEA